MPDKDDQELIFAHDFNCFYFIFTHKYRMFWSSRVVNNFVSDDDHSLIFLVEVACVLMYF